MRRTGEEDARGCERTPEEKAAIKALADADSRSGITTTRMTGMTKIPNTERSHGANNTDYEHEKDKRKLPARRWLTRLVRRFGNGLTITGRRWLPPLEDFSTVRRSSCCGAKAEGEGAIDAGICPDCHEPLHV